MAKNVSNQFKNIIKNGGPFYAYAAVTFADGSQTIMNSKTDFMATGNGYSESSEAGFPLGVAISKTITLNIDNTTAYESIQDTEGRHIQDTTGEDILANKKSVEEDYYNARIVLYTEADLPDGTQERVQEGIFTVIDSVRPDEVLEITAYDDMYKADVAFYSSLTYPVSVQMLLNEVCNFCDITLGSATFKNNDYQIHQAPQNLTARQVIGYIAQIAGGNAVIDRNGRLVIKSYDLSGFDASEEISSDEIESESGIHIFSRFTSAPDIGVADVIITGVSTEVEDENGEDEVYLVGTEEYAISVDNPLITGNEQDAVNRIAESIMGLRMRPFSGNFLPDPTVEFMDLCYVIDRKDNIYKSFVTLHDFDYLGGSMFANETESPQKFGGTYYSEAAQAYQKAKEDIKNNKKQWEQAIENLSQQVANSSGLYTTKEEQPDGSTIFYMHNKPTLEESDIVWKMTAETLTVSTDGGHSWNAGITVNGEVIARIMNTIGINFDWGVGGTLIIQDEEGNQTAYIDAETGTVRLAVESLTITGKTVQEIASEQSDETLNNFVDSVYNPAIGNLQAQIDGQIETYYYDYEPTLNNEPASEWTTEKERMAHEGDLFYWKSRGYAYRFFKDGDTWKWQMVQDTDITKALEQAAEAKDTADQKRRVFVRQPTPPYDVGDLWVGNNASDLMRCQRSRSSGSYNADDWIKAVKYTDDTELNNFIREDYSETIQEIYNSVDKKAQTWYQTTDPSLDWASIEESVLQDTDGNSILDSENNDIITLWEREKSTHDGDLWRNPANNTEYMYVDGNWVEMSIPDDLFDTIDGKAQIFVVQPTPPYAVGDVWFTGTTILVCDTARESGEFNANDWTKRDNYTDDSALYEFIEGDYASTIDELQTQSDKKAETWYQANDPSTHWNADEKLKHDGDLWYNTSSQKTYIYNGSAWEETKSNPPDEVFDTIDGKAQIFVRQPLPPYAVGDLWFDSASSDIMTCIYSRESGNFNAGDWQKRNKYTDDSALQNFLSGEYSETITELKTQADKKAETWYQGTDPSTSWNATQKAEHEGDIWYNTSNQKTYIYDGSAWQETKSTPPDEVFDEIDGKAQIFVRQPVPPYSVGDLWFNSATSDIMTCINGRESGSYTSSDWQKRNKYTDNSYAEEVAGDLSNFADQVVGDLENMQTQIDGKIETYYYDYQPTLTNIPASAWTTETERQKHIGDLFYYKSTGFTYRFLKDGSTWKWQPIKDEDISKALSDAAEAQDTADQKRRVFITTPVPPYDSGDLWMQGASGDIMTCVNSRQSGNYVSSDWEKKNKYTDDTAVTELDQSLGQQGVFNRLTNNGKTKGLYLTEDNELYLNATYIKTGVITDNIGNNYWNLSNGEFRLSPTTTVGNQEIATKNNTISSVDVEYASGTSNTTPPETGWSTNSPEWQEGRYIWQRTVTTMADGSKSISDPTCIQGAAGQQGEQGIQGPPGEDGQTLYTWIKYADTPTSGMSDTPDGKKYLGIAYNKASPIESTNYSDYSWSDIKGKDGVPGTPGKNGQTLYTWIKYATSATGANMSDDPTGKEYIGIAYNKTTATESTNRYDYAWSLIQGEAGIGVKGIVELYYLSNSSTTQTGGSWSTAQPAWQKGKYIWTRSQITWTDNSVTFTNPVLAKAINGANEAVDDLDTSLDQQEVFNRLTNNGKAQGIILQNGQLYINAEYIQSLILKVGGVNNENGTFEVYNGSGVLVGKIDKDGAKFTNGNDWLQISQSLLTGGYGSTTDGVLDLSANYSDGSRNVVLESKTGDVILKSSNEFRVQRQSGGMGYLVQSGGTDYFDEIEVSFGDTYPVIGIMYGEDEQGYNPFLDIRLANGKSVYFSGGTPPSIADSFLVRQVSAAVTQSHGYGERLISLSYSGYKALGVVGYSISSTYHAMYKMNFDSSKQTVTVGIRHVNDTSASGSINVYLQVLYVKS